MQVTGGNNISGCNMHNSRRARTTAEHGFIHRVQAQTLAQCCAQETTAVNNYTA
jgi:hypothetical protein